MRRSGSQQVTLAILASLGVLALFGLQLHHAQRTAARLIGFSFEAEASGIKVLEVRPGSPGEGAGLASADSILSINGKRVLTEMEYDQLADGFVPGQPVVFEVQRGTSLERLSLRPGVPLDWRELGLGIFGVLIHLALWGLGFVQPSRDLRARLLAFLALAIAVELALPTASVGSPATWIWSNLLFYLSTGIQFSLELHLLSMIPDRRPFLRRRPWLVPTYYLGGLTFAGVAATTFWIEAKHGAGLTPLSSGQVDDALNLWFLPLWALMSVSLLATSSLTWPRPQGRQQAALVLVGLLPWAAVTLARTSLILLDRPLPHWLGQAEELAIVLFPIAVFVAIFRSHLFDLALVARKSLFYTVATSLVVLMFYALVGMGGALLSDLLGGSSSVWVVGGATLILGLLFSPLKEAIQEWIDRRFFPHRNEMRQRLISLADGLPSQGKVGSMAQHLVEQMRQIFAVKTAVLYMAPTADSPLVPLAYAGSKRPSALFLSPSDTGVMALFSLRSPVTVAETKRHWGPAPRLVVRLGGEIAVPLLHQSQALGLLILGEKTDGRPFAADEQEMLQLLGHHVATVFENARLFNAATEDGLTTLLRREAALAQLAVETTRACRHHRPLTVAMVDLDHFKQINDEFGHPAGDAMLRAVARAIKEELRSTDAIGRYGGEEFLLVLPETDLAGASQVAEKLRKRVAGVKVETEDGREIAVSLSIGFATLDTRQGDVETTPESLVAAADQALYRAKNTGRNRVEGAHGLTMVR